MPQVRELTQQKRTTKQHESSFWFTINLNKPYSPEVEQTLRTALNTMLGDDRYSYLRFKHYRDANNTPEAIADTNLQFRIEVGPQNGLLHAHLLLQFKHESNIQIANAAVRRIMMELTGLKGIRVDNITYIDDIGWGQRILAYMQK